MPNLQIKNSTPRQDGFVMMSNFQHHNKVYLLWPERPDVFRDHAVHTQSLVARIVNFISQYDEVYIGVNDLENIKNFTFNKNVKIFKTEYDDAWLGDSGPFTLVSESSDEHRASIFGFNAWGGENGGLYTSWEKDKKIAEKICQKEKVKYYSALNFVLEGGSIVANGKGTIVLTEETLLNPNRNPEYTKQDIEKVLSEYLGVKKFIWLKYGLYADETSGHVDNVCNFLTEDKMVISWCTDKNNIQYQRLQENYKILRKATTAEGKKIKLYKLEIPYVANVTKEEDASFIKVKGSKPRVEGNILPGTYTNMFIGDKYVVLPKYNCKTDAAALRTIQKIYGDKEIYNYDSRELLISGGNVHCILKKI